MGHGSVCCRVRFVCLVREEAVRCVYSMGGCDRDVPGGLDPVGTVSGCHGGVRVRDISILRVALCFAACLLHLC